MKKILISLMIGAILFGGTVTGVDARGGFGGGNKGQCTNYEDCPQDHENCPNFTGVKVKNTKGQGRTQGNNQRMGGNRQFNCLK